MSEEWLKKLAELSNDKQLMKRAQQMQRQSASRGSGGRQGSLFGAAFGTWFRFLIFFGLIEAVVLFAFSENGGSANVSLGDHLRYALYYVLSAQALPADLYNGLQQLTGLTSDNLGAAYDWMQPTLDSSADVLVFVIPAALALILTVYFLPWINAARRRSPIRLIVYLLNLAAAPLLLKFTGAPVLWLGAFVLSFAGRGGLQLPQAKLKRPPPSAAPTPQKARAAAAPAKVPAAATGASHSAREAVSLKREPTVIRRGGGSWVRPR